MQVQHLKEHWPLGLLPAVSYFVTADHTHGPGLPSGAGGGRAEEGSCWDVGSSPAEENDPQYSDSKLRGCGQLDSHGSLRCSQTPCPQPAAATHLVGREAGDNLPASMWL